MAEVNVTRTKLAQVAGAKSPAASNNRVRTAVVTMAAAYAAPAQNDIAGTEIVLRKGTRLACPVTVSNGTGTASSTLSVGIRNPITKVAIDAAAIVTDVAITTAATVQVNTGAKLITGQDYLLLEDAEIYLTFTGAVGAANQQIRVEVPYIAP